MEPVFFFLLGTWRWTVNISIYLYLGFIWIIQIQLCMNQMHWLLISLHIRKIQWVPPKQMMFINFRVADLRSVMINIDSYIYNVKLCFRHFILHLLCKDLSLSSDVLYEVYFNVKCLLVYLHKVYCMNNFWFPLNK